MKFLVQLEEMEKRVLQRLVHKKMWDIEDWMEEHQGIDLSDAERDKMKRRERILDTLYSIEQKLQSKGV